MTKVRGLASSTLRTYGARISAFLEWVAERHDSLASVTLEDIDVFLDLKRAEGMKSNSVAANCQALRTFFRYAESIGRCRTGIARGIRSPAIPKFDGKPKGLSWTKVRRLIRSASRDNASDIRARAILLLCAVYGLRANEVARLRLSDFDWQNETLTVVRSKRGKLSITRSNMRRPKQSWHTCGKGGPTAPLAVFLLPSHHLFDSWQLPRSGQSLASESGGLDLNVSTLGLIPCDTLARRNF
jgi:site-specific recombinase XerD